MKNPASVLAVCEKRYSDEILSHLSGLLDLSLPDTAVTEKEALDLLSKKAYDIVICEYGFADLRIIDIIKKARQKNAGVIVFILSKDGELMDIIPIKASVPRIYTIKTDSYPGIIKEITNIIRALMKSDGDTGKDGCKIPFELISSLTFDWEMLTDRHDNIIFISGPCQKITGYSREDFLNDKSLLKSIIHPDDVKSYREHEECRNSDPCGILSLDFRIVNRDGEFRWIEHKCMPLLGDGLEVEGYWISNRDITATREAEGALRESREKYRDLVENINEVIFSLDKDGIFTYVSPVVETLDGGFDYTVEELVGKSFTTFIHPDDVAGVVEKFKNTMNGVLDEIEFRVVSKDGKERWLLESGRPIIKNGEVFGVRGIFSDITKCKMDQIRLKANEARLNAIMQGTPIPKFMIDSNHKIIFWNRALEEFSRIPADEVIGTNQQWRAFYPEERPCLADLILDEDVSVIKRWYGEKGRRSQLITDAWEAMDFFPSLGKRGRWVYFTAALIRDSGGKIIGSLETVEDFTEQKNAEQMLKEVNKKLNLLSSITRHDILNQLTALIGYTEILRDEVKDTKLGEYVKRQEMVAYNIKKQITFTRDYKDLGEQAPDWYNAGTIIEDIRQCTDLREVEIVNRVDDLEVFSDPLFEKVIFNLIDNSLKHGGESLSKIVFSCKEENNELKLICEDDGEGVPAEYKEKIFLRQYYKNTGLGLFLSKEILSITGMEICETGTPGKGARFEITVPSGHYKFGE